MILQPIQYMGGLAIYSLTPLIGEEQSWHDYVGVMFFAHFMHNSYTTLRIFFFFFFYDQLLNI
jgi:hypothetical protein